MFNNTSNSIFNYFIFSQNDPFWAVGLKVLALLFMLWLTLKLIVVFRGLAAKKIKRIHSYLILGKPFGVLKTATSLLFNAIYIAALFLSVINIAGVSSTGDINYLNIENIYLWPLWISVTGALILILSEVWLYLILENVNKKEEEL